MNDNTAASTLATTAAAIVEKAAEKVVIPTLVPATVLGYDISTRTATVAIDGDGGEASTVDNITGHFLGVDQRVMVGFFPPHGVFVVGVVTPQRYPNTAADFLDVDAAGDSTVSTSLVEFPTSAGGGPVTCTLDKIADDTSLQVTIHVSRFYSGFTGRIMTWGVLIDGSPFNIFRCFPVVSTDTQASGTRRVSGLDAGAHTITMAASIGVADGAVVVDGTSICSLLVEEVP